MKRRYVSRACQQYTRLRVAFQAEKRSIDNNSPTHPHGSRNLIGFSGKNSRKFCSDFSRGAAGYRPEFARLAERRSPDRLWAFVLRSAPACVSIQPSSLFLPSKPTRTSALRGQCPDAPVHSPRYTQRAVQVSATTISVSNGSLGLSCFQIHAATTSLVGFSRPRISFR